MSRQQVEKIIEKRLKSIKGVERFYIEKKNQGSIDVVVVLSRLDDSKITSQILTFETKINKDYKIPSDFKLYPSGALAL